ncbi:hypothetical protein [Spirosoma telluris]|uniref:hypothetical protein n=1 Tax=Spirosoma telluris TaxID=2183553 RepID=UPI002FC2A82F
MANWRYRYGPGINSGHGVAIGFVWYFFWLAWKYFNWRYSFIVRFPIQHTAHNVIGTWRAKGPDENRKKVILMAHYDTAPVSLLYSPKQQSNFRISLLISLWLMLLAASLATLEVFKVALPYLTYIRYGLIGYFILQAIIGTAGYWLKGIPTGPAIMQQVWQQHWLPPNDSSRLTYPVLK